MTEDIRLPYFRSRRETSRKFDWLAFWTAKMRTKQFPEKEENRGFRKGFCHCECYLRDRWKSLSGRSNARQFFDIDTTQHVFPLKSFVFLLRNGHLPFVVIDESSALAIDLCAWTKKRSPPAKLIGKNSRNAIFNAIICCERVLRPFLESIDQVLLHSNTILHFITPSTLPHGHLPSFCREGGEASHSPLLSLPLHIFFINLSIFFLALGAFLSSS